MLSMPFGKYKGLPLHRVPPDYLCWCLDNCTNLNPSFREAVEQVVFGESADSAYRRGYEDGYQAGLAKTAAAAANAGHASAPFSAPADPVDFLIKGKGSNSVQCGGAVTTNCATSASDISSYLFEMDNAGRTFVSYDNGGNWRMF